MWLNDQKNSEDYYIIDENLHDSIKSIFSKNSYAHLVLKISYSQENDIYIIADSLIQKGWIKNKLQFIVSAQLLTIDMIIMVIVSENSPPSAEAT